MFESVHNGEKCYSIYCNNNCLELKLIVLPDSGNKSMNRPLMHNDCLSIAMREGNLSICIVLCLMSFDPYFSLCNFS